MYVTFNIIRKSHRAPYVARYTLEIDPSATILDCLNRIKWEQDGSLAFRKNCRNTICGSCGMKINGRSALACKESVGGELSRLAADGPPEHSPEHITQSQPCGSTADAPVMTIAPMGNMPVIKDLVVDMQSFWDNLEAVNPYVSAQARQLPQGQPLGEFLQAPDERDRLNQAGNCILCGACYSECNAREANPDFVGPHALAKAQRLLADSRDDQTEARQQRYGDGINGNITSGIWGCTRCYYCNTVCPMDVAPMDRIGEIKQGILQRQTADASRPVRHRKAMVELVKRGGWVDERQFGVMVVGNYLRDLQGLASLGPLGLRMLMRGKLPWRFEPSEGVAQVRSLIEAVQEHNAAAPVFEK
ncbi:MAG: succinate dehydrogenase/fumarate reductase iron-sulfur subunit [Elainellaceae cyanobacterium]